MSYRRLFIFLFVVFIFAACSPSKKTVTEIPHIPTGIHLPDSLAVLPASDIDLPLKIPASVILAQVDSVVPKEFLSDNWPKYSQPSCDFRYKYRFVRSALNVTCANNKINIQFIGSYQLSGSKCICAMNKSISPWVSGACGYGNESLRRIVINISSELNFLSNYKLRSYSKLESLISLDKCVVSMFSNDVTGLVADSVRSSVNAFCSSLDKNIAGMDFSKTIQDAIRKVYASMPIGNYGYVSINPTLIRVGKLNLLQDTFSISVGATCRPALGSDSIVKTVFFPPLVAGDNKNSVAVYLNADYAYGFISKLLNDSLRNKVFELNGRTIVIKDLFVRGFGNHQIEVQVDFSGTNKGRVYLRGTPVFDATNQTLTVPDISYSLEGEDLALKIGKTLFRNKIRKNLQGKTYLDIAALIKSNLPMLNSKLNNRVSNNINTAGMFNEVKILGLLAQKNGIQLQLYANANISIIGTSLPR